MICSSNDLPMICDVVAKVRVRKVLVGERGVSGLRVERLRGGSTQWVRGGWQLVGVVPQ